MSPQAYLFYISILFLDETHHLDQGSLFVSSLLKNETNSSIVSSILLESILEPSFHIPASLYHVSSSISGEPYPMSNLIFSLMKERVRI